MLHATGASTRIDAPRPLEEESMPTARARHILVTTEEACAKLKQEIAAGADFAGLAKEHSQCPSGRSGGKS